MDHASVNGRAGGIGAVVIGGDYQGLGIVRSLGRHGIPVCVIDDEPSIARFSRYASLSVRVPDLKDYQRAVDSLLEAGTRHGLRGWVLYPTRDELVAAISRRRGELTELFRVPTPEWSQVQVAWDKRLTYELARRLDVPFPRSWRADNLEELQQSLPLALKPAIKEHFIYASHKKALGASTMEELRAAFQEACAVIPPSEVILQELVPGGGECQFSYCAFAKEGKPLAFLTARRTRQHPPDFGRASTYVETMAVPELHGPSEKILAALRYYGLVEVEYKRDPRDGLFKLLDINMRTWGYHSIGAAAGMDFPFLLFQDQVGAGVEPSGVEPSCAALGVRWVRLMTDVPTSLAEIARGNLRAGDYLRSIVHADTEAVFAKDDPLPGLAELAHLPYLLRTRGGRIGSLAARNNGHAAVSRRGRRAA